jgi:hypothetical protein
LSSPPEFSNWTFALDVNPAPRDEDVRTHERYRHDRDAPIDLPLGAWVRWGNAGADGRTPMTAEAEHTSSEAFMLSGQG